jgi:hypothetical protein
MSTPRRLATQSRCRRLDYSHLVSADEDDVLVRLVDWIRHSRREVIARRGDFRLWHFSDLMLSLGDVCSSG